MVDQYRKELNPVQAMQSAKRGTKEVSRQLILDTTLQLGGEKTVTNWVEVNKLVKEKQAAVSKNMPPTTKQAPKVNKITLSIPRIKKKSMKVTARQYIKATPKDAKSQVTTLRPAAALNNIKKYTRRR